MAPAGIHSVALRQEGQCRWQAKAGLGGAGLVDSDLPQAHLASAGHDVQEDNAIVDVQVGTTYRLRSLKWRVASGVMVRLIIGCDARRGMWLVA